MPPKKSLKRKTKADPDDTDVESDDDVKTKKSKGVSGVWQWKMGDGVWKTYAPEDIAMLESEFKRGTKKFDTTNLSFNAAHKTVYTFDYEALTQRNGDTGKVRTIQRIDAAGDATSADGDAGYASVVRTSSAGWSAPSVKKKKTAAKKKAPVKKKVPATPAPIVPLTPSEIKEQAALGGQSLRKQKSTSYGPSISADSHGTYCFDRMLENEQRLCGEWAVFYHSYSLAALLYEVQSAVAAVLFRFKSTFATLPRLLKRPFDDLPNAQELMTFFKTLSAQDHDPTYRSVAICGTSSLLADDSEAPPKNVFLMGYSCSDLSFMGVLKELLSSCHVPKGKVDALAKKIVKLSEDHGLDVSQFHGKGCKSGRPGHLLQIFIKRHLVDRYIYAAHPYGVIDHKRMPLGEFINGKGPMKGQVRILCHPSIFMKASAVRMFVYSADPTYHGKREAFQEKLTALLHPILGNDEVRVEAATGIMGGQLPDWFDSADQGSLAKVTNHYK